MSGKLLASSTLQNVAAAEKGEDLFDPDRTDGIAWNLLLSYDNKYKIFDSPGFHSQTPSSHEEHATHLVICTIITSQEAYVDEWVDYHLALGISVYLIDSSDAFWMRQWSDDRQLNSTAKVVHFPGNVSNPEFIAKAHASCLEYNIQKQKKVLLMEVNDFLMPAHPLEQDFFKKNLRHDHKDCTLNITKIRRVLFGNANQKVYDPLPVTMRFQQRVRITRNDINNSLKPILFTSSLVTEHDILKYITTGDLGSDQCVAESAELVAYHYTRSQKECKQQRGDDRVCSHTGDIMDTSGWESVQKVLPVYSGYNGFI
jgi:hypothetical protein